MRGGRALRFGLSILLATTACAAHAAPEFRVQRGVTRVGQGVHEEPLPLPVRSLETAFARLRNASDLSAGLDSDVDHGLWHSRELATRVRLADLRTLRFERAHARAGETHRVYWEVWEYLGPPGGPNEFVVRTPGHATLAWRPPQRSGRVPVADVADPERLVLFHSGGGADSTVHSRGNVRLAWDAATREVVWSRGPSKDPGAVSFAAVEFTGAGWSVQQTALVFPQDHKKSNDPACPPPCPECGRQEDRSHSARLPRDVGDWSHAFIVSTHEAFESAVSANTWSVWPGERSDEIRYRLRDWDDGCWKNHDITAFVVSNPAVDVRHDYTRPLGGERRRLPRGASGEPIQVETRPIRRPDLTPAEIERAALICRVNEFSRSNEIARGAWSCALVGPDSIEFRRSIQGQASDYSTQVIVLP